MILFVLWTFVSTPLYKISSQIHIYPKNIPQHYFVSWEPEGHYQYSNMFRWEPEGGYCCTKPMAIAPFWFSTEHLWSVITPFWLSTDDIYPKNIPQHCLVSWEPEGHYQYSNMFCWEPEGGYCCTKSMVIAPFWFSTEHLWILIAPFWLSTAWSIYLNMASLWESETMTVSID